MTRYPESAFTAPSPPVWPGRPGRRVVQSPGQLSDVFKRAENFYRTRLAIAIDAYVDPSCVRLVRDLPEGMTGLASWVVSPSGDHIRDVDIQLQSGGSVVCTAGVLTHEVFHILSAHWRLTLMHKHEEGLANLAQYLFLRHEPDLEARRLAWMLRENGCPIYGDGFREARQVYRREASFRRAIARLSMSSMHPTWRDARTPWVTPGG